MNTVGPKNLPNNSGDHSDMSLWLSSTGIGDIFEYSPWTDVAQDYKRMREKLGNWDSRQFDRFMSNYGTYGYDISAAANQYGSWIGWGNQPAWKSTAADKCTATLFPNMTQQERVDYIMLLPPTAMNPATPETNNQPTEKYPEWSIRKKPAHPNVEIDRHFIDDEKGCVSDHAEVIAHLQFVHLLAHTGYNPYKYHRVKYSVSDIWDIHEDDPGDEAEFFGNMSIDVTGQATVQDSWNEDTTPRDGFHSNPGWYLLSNVFGGNVVVNTRVQTQQDGPAQVCLDQQPAPRRLSRYAPRVRSHERQIMAHRLCRPLSGQCSPQRLWSLLGLFAHELRQGLCELVQFFHLDRG
jgi:hypothetical protein